MFRNPERARRRASAYLVTFPAVAIAAWASASIAGTDARPLAAAPLALAVAACAVYGGLGPGLFALVQATLAVGAFLLEPGVRFHPASQMQSAALAGFVGACALFCVLVAHLERRTEQLRVQRSRAEAASAHAMRMTQLTSALAQARTPRAAIEAAVQESIYALHGDAAALFLTSKDMRFAETARAVGYPPGAIPESVTLSEKGPVSDAVGRGVPIVIESLIARAREYPGSEVLGRQYETAVIVPFLIGSRVVAALQVEFGQVRAITEDDREYLQALAHGGAQALDRTWQLELAERGRVDAERLREQADRELDERRSVEHALRGSETRYRVLAARTSRLHALSAALSEAVTMEAVGRAVITHGQTVVGATAGELLLLVDDGAQFETLYAEGNDRSGGARISVPVEDGMCSTAAVRTGRPVFIRSLDEWQQGFWKSASVAADGGYQSSATMPLLVEGAPIGVLTFHFTVPVNFDHEYQALLVSVAEHCGQALDRARLYESTQRARADAESANRLKDEFVSIVSHELRTPLNAILGWTTMLLNGTLPAEKSPRALRSVHDNASRQARLIEELLDFSRVTSGRASLQFERVDVRALLRGVVESMIPSAVGRAVELSLSTVPPVYVQGDLRRLEQVFFNLIDNALKFTPEGGRITIDVRSVGRHIEIQVRDTGSGIDADFLPHVFERFRQADAGANRTHGGLGLGMSIAKQLVESHHGEIRAASEGKGRGTTFTVVLPTSAQIADAPAQPPVEKTPDSASPPNRTPLEGLHVLVVDDEEDARELMATALEASGASVDVAGCAHDALEILGRRHIDVLVSDIAMPDEDGLALIRRVRASGAPTFAAVPAAAVTAFSGSTDREQALAAGFQVHLAKPFEPSELVRTVEKLAQEVGP